MKRKSCRPCDPAYPSCLSSVSLTASESDIIAVEYIVIPCIGWVSIIATWIFECSTSTPIFQMSPFFCLWSWVCHTLYVNGGPRRSQALLFIVLCAVVAAMLTELIRTAFFELCSHSHSINNERAFQILHHMMFLHICCPQKLGQLKALRELGLAIASLSPCRFHFL